MKIILTIEDTSMGGVKIEAHPNASELMTVLKGRPAASTSACMYALGMMTWAASRSREIGKGTMLVLPPGVRA